MTGAVVYLDVPRAWRARHALEQTVWTSLVAGRVILWSDP